MVWRRHLILSPEQRASLAYLRDHDPRPQVRERCGALVKVADGQSPHAVALHGLLKRRDPDTVYGWIDLYERAGVTALIRCQHGGYRGRRL